MIENLTTQKKSELLLEAMGWKLADPGQELVGWFGRGGLDISALVEQSVDGSGLYWFDETGAIRREGRPDLYDLSDVRAVLDVFHWFYNETDLYDKLAERWSLYNLMAHGLDTILHLVLDEILRICIEDGIVADKELNDG